MKQNSTHACFTGHRIVNKLDIDELKSNLDRIILSLANQKISTFLNGGAIGFDMLAAERVISLKELYGLSIKLVTVLPCRGHEAKWENTDKMRLLCILENSDDVIYLSEQYYDGCMKSRNEYLVKHSNICIAYMKHGRSGTSQTVRMAKEQGLEVINLAEKF